MFKQVSFLKLILHMRGGVLIQPIAMEVGAFVKVTNVMKHANFAACMLKGLVSAKGPIFVFFSVGSCHGLTTVSCARALACNLNGVATNGVATIT